jgi:hypothetical protein
MNRSTKKLGMATMEDRRFRSFFGVQNEVVLKVWGMLGEGGLRPANSKPKHLLLALYFLKVFPREGPGCSAVRGLKGAIGPKTMHKWVWLFLECIAELADNVVSDLILLYPCLSLSHLVASSIISHQTTDCF